MPRKSKSKRSLPNKSPRQAKSMVQLEKENEIIYNKKHIWMKRVFIDFLKFMCGLSLLVVWFNIINIHYLVLTLIYLKFTRITFSAVVVFENC